MSNFKYNILIVDDEENVLTSLALALKKEYNVFCAKSGKHALDIFRKEEIHLVFLDLSLDDINGIDVLKEMKNINSSSEIVIITATKDIGTAVRAIKQGAYDYITKPYEIEKIKNIAEKIIEKLELASEVELLKSMKGGNVLIGKSQAIRRIKNLIKKFSSNKSTVLITGESGTGKEVVAKNIHFSSIYRNKPFVPVHTGAISEGIIESELFGHEKGAFTGAHKRKIGKFEHANGGTIFLDEISTMNQSMQIKLLRVLQDKSFTPVGSTNTIKVDVRIIAATNSNLEEDVKKGKFREDLYYRLKVLSIHIPPLRERKEDIKPLADYFLNVFKDEFKKNVSAFSQEAMEILINYNWPGNVRELKNVIERAVVLSDGEIIERKHLPQELYFYSGKKKDMEAGSFKNRIFEIERNQLIEILEENGWNKTKAARELGIHRNTLLYRLKKLGLQ